MEQLLKIPIQKIELSKLGFASSVELSILREDLIHPHISGNKYRKLKYNLLEAKQQNKCQLLSFGGAFSNHISAVAYAGKKYNFQTIGCIRGEELASKIDENPTLSFAKSCGMEFVFLTRAEYKDKKDKDFLLDLQSKHPNAFIIPEGGTNAFAIKGCEEIITPEMSEFDFICCPVGTGGTISGLINAKFSHQKILGFPALKNADFLHQIIQQFTSNNEYEMINTYHFGGYAKITDELINFVNLFNAQYNIPLDPIYTGKMLFGIIDLIRNNKFKENSKILAVHTGGLQGIEGINKKLKQQQKQPIL